MQTATMDAVKALLKTDPGLTPLDHTRIMAAIRNHGRELEPVRPPATETRIMTRSEVAQRFNRTRRFVDHLAKAGVLRRVMLPGRVRACGFLAVEVERVITGEVPAK